MEFFHHQHPARGQPGEDGRDGDLGDIVQPGGHLGHVAGLGAEVQLGAEVAGELGGQVSHPVGGAPGGVGLDPAGQPDQDGQVALDRVLNSRPLDLSDDLLPAGQHRAVGLGDGGGSDRIPVEFREDLGNWPPGLILHQRAHRFGVRR